MQLVLDSTEKLDNALRAVGGLYGVEVTVVGGAATPSTRRRAAAPANKAARGGRGARGARRPGRPGRPSRRPDASDIRTWARANGHAVSDRGRIPDSVVTAYERAS